MKTIIEFFMNNNMTVPVLAAVGMAVVDYIVEKSKKKENSLLSVIITAVRDKLKKK